jgi:hypothetical protein
MATVVHEVTTPVTTNATSYVSGSFTPAAGDLLVVFVRAGATADAGAVTSSAGLTFTKVDHATFRTSLDRIYCFVSNQAAAASAQTVTFACAGDAADGSVIFVASVTGMTRYGLSAVRQSAKQENQAAAGTPAPAFASAALTGNPTLGCVGNSTNPAGLTAPTSWTELADSGYATPTSGAEYIHRNSGFTGTTITWGSTSATAFGSLIIELDTSAPVAAVISVTVTPRSISVPVFKPPRSQILNVLAPAVGGPTTYNITPSGSVTAAGVLRRQAGKTLTATATPAGALIRQTRRTLIGSSTPSGALATTKVALRAFAGTLTSSGLLSRQVQRPLTGSGTPAGALTKRTARTLAGSSTPSGALATVRSKLLAVAGALTASGVLTRQTRRTVTGSSTPTGVLVRQPRKPLAGSSTASGAIALVKAFLRSFGGSVTAAGAVTRRANKPLGGTATPTGAMTRRTSRTLTGASTASGALTRSRLVPKAIGGTVTAAGTVRRQLSRALGGTLSPTGAALKVLSRLLGGSSTPTGSVTITGGGLGIPDEAPYHFTFRQPPRPGLHEGARPAVRESRHTPSMREGEGSP